MRQRLKSPASGLFIQVFIQAQIKENIKALRHWPLCGEVTDDQWIPRTKAGNAENASIWLRHHDNTIFLLRIASYAPALLTNPNNELTIVYWLIHKLINQVSLE